MGLFGFLKKGSPLQEPSQPELAVAPDPELVPNDLPPLEPIKQPETPVLTSFDDMPSTLEEPNHNFMFPQNTDAFQPPEPVNLDEELNKLFIPDNWQEPDWTTFDSYQDPEIEPPTPEDFGISPASSSDLPSFQDQAQQPSWIQQEASEPEESQPMQEEIVQEQPIQELHAYTGNVPVELYIKGSEYRNVFSELTRINELLRIQDPKINKMDEFYQLEDSSMTKCKENMEFLYKKFSLIDNHLF